MYKVLYSSIGASIISTFLAISAPKANAQNINLQGTVINSCCETPEDSVKVDIFKGDSPVDHTFTDINGNYSMTFTLTGTTEIQSNLKNRLYPNPSKGQSNLEIYSEVQDLYKMMITDINGKTLLNTDLKLNAGNNLINLVGGQAGMYTITLTNGKETITQKVIQNTNTNMPFDYRVIQTNTPTKKQLKSGLDDIVLIGDEITAVFAKPGFYTSDLTFFANENNIINASVTPVAQPFHFWLKAYTVDGLPANLTLSVKFPGMTTFQNHTVYNGITEFNGSICDCSGSIAEFKIDTTIVGNEYLSQWIIIRDPNQAALFLPNIAQSQKEVGMPPGTTLLNLFDPRLNNDTNYMYVIRKEVPDPRTPGAMIRTDSDLFKGMATAALAGKTVKYTYVPGIDSIDFAVYPDNLSTGQTVSSTKVDSAFFDAKTVISWYQNMPNGDHQLPPIRVYKLPDPRWTGVPARDFDQMAYTGFDNVSPGTGWSGTEETFVNSTIAGELRIKNSSSGYSIISNPALRRVEIEQGLSKIEDPQQPGGSTVYLVTPTGEKTPYNDEIRGVIQFLDPGTDFY